jgi:uncharacterized protein YdbL (DUF1318 family)
MFRSRPIRFILVTLVAVWITNCVTVNITVNFPEAAVEEAADEINREIRGDIFEEAEEGQPSSWLNLPLRRSPIRVAVHFGTVSAHAQPAQIDLKVTNPVIRKLNKQRAERAKTINQYLAKAYIGEGTDGYLKEMSAIESLALMELAKTRQEVKKENTDRKALYQEFANINDLPFDKVAEVFAESNRKWLLAGQYYMNKKGNWLKKTKEEEERDRKELKEKGLLE